MRWRDVGAYWGTSEEERRIAFPCDDVLPEANTAYYRGVSVEASAEQLFPWLCQLRVAPYSYDWLDNRGRRSPQVLSPELAQLEVGQPFMKIFDLVSFEKDRHVTLQYRRPGTFPPLAVSYLIVGSAGPLRLLVKLALCVGPGLRGTLTRAIGSWGDWIMMRRQLLNLKALAEGTSADEPPAGAPGRQGTALSP